MTEFSSQTFTPCSADASDSPPAATLAAPDFPYIGDGYDLTEFPEYLRRYDFGTVPPDFLVLHHTERPAASWAPAGDPGKFWDAHEATLSTAAIYAKRQKQLGAIRNYYQTQLGWSAGPHIFIDDRWAWLMSPMAEPGIHAAAGNSYRRGGVFHYSIGIEVVGSYTLNRWPSLIQSQVRGVVRLLQARLGTFQLKIGRGAGFVDLHRHYNKPACPGNALTDAFIQQVLSGRTAPPAPSALTTYRCTNRENMNIRSAPSDKATKVDVLHYGETVRGKRVPGVVQGKPATWVRLYTPSGIPQSRYVWIGGLEETT